MRAPSIAKHWTRRAMRDYHGYHENDSRAFQDLLAQQNRAAWLSILNLFLNPENRQETK